MSVFDAAWVEQASGHTGPLVDDEEESRSPGVQEQLGDFAMLLYHVDVVSESVQNRCRDEGCCDATSQL